MLEHLKLGNKEEAKKCKETKDELWKQYDRENELAEERIFNHLNRIDTLHQYIDLHGQHRERALTIAATRLNETKEAIEQGSLVPNVYGNKNHILKIICGKGNHSH